MKAVSQQGRLPLPSIGVKINPRKARDMGLDERRWTTERIQPRSGVVI